MWRLCVGKYKRSLFLSKEDEQGRWKIWVRKDTYYLPLNLGVF